MLFLEGQGTDQDLDAAASLFRAGAEMGNAKAQHRLAIMHSKGQGVKQDLVEAYVWLERAVKAGNAAALKTRTLAGKQLTPVQLSEAEKRAGDWVPKKS